MESPILSGVDYAYYTYILCENPHKVGCKVDIADVSRKINPNAKSKPPTSTLPLSKDEQENYDKYVPKSLLTKSTPELTAAEKRVEMEYFANKRANKAAKSIGVALNQVKLRKLS